LSIIIEIFIGATGSKSETASGDEMFLGRPRMIICGAISDVKSLASKFIPVGLSGVGGVNGGGVEEMSGDEGLFTRGEDGK